MVAKTQMGRTFFDASLVLHGRGGIASILLGADNSVCYTLYVCSAASSLWTFGAICLIVLYYHSTACRAAAQRSFAHSLILIPNRSWCFTLLYYYSLLTRVHNQSFLILSFSVER